MDFYLIIPASGSGNRFGSKTPKQFFKISGKEILIHTLNRFNTVRGIKSIFISTQTEYIKLINSLIKKYNIKKVSKVVEGGSYRQDSVYNALLSINANKNDRIIIHDAVRPFLSKKLLYKLMNESITNDCVIPALKLTDTIKISDNKSFVISTIPRENLWSAQTPQIFEYQKLMKSFELSKARKIIGTDEAYLMEYAGYKVKIIEGETSNIKITTRKDIK